MDFKVNVIYGTVVSNIAHNLPRNIICISYLPPRYTNLPFSQNGLFLYKIIGDFLILQTMIWHLS